MMDNSLYKIIWEQVKPTIINKINSGDAKIAPNGGVVYENGKILTHLPLEKIQDGGKILAGGPLPLIDTASKVASNVQLNHIQKDITKLLSLTQLNIGLTICSAAVVVGAIVVATQYLSKKLDKMDKKLDEIKALLREVADFQLIDSISTYKGNILSLQPYYEQEITISNTICMNHLSSITNTRNKLISLMSDSKNKMFQSNSKDYASMYYQYINNFMEIVPFGMMLEYSLYCKLNEFNTADYNVNITSNFYKQLRYDMLKFTFQQKNNLIHGNKCLVNVDMNEIKQLNKIGENDFIVALPQGVPVMNNTLQLYGKKIYTK